MTGSEMGGLMIGFVKYIAGFFAVVFAAGSALADGWFQVALLVVAAALAVVSLLSHRAIKRYEERYYAGRREQDAQDRARNPKLYDAMDKLMAIDKQLPGCLPWSSCGYGSASVANPEAGYVLWIHINVDDWDGDTPRSVKGTPYADVAKRVPTEIDGYKVTVSPRKVRAKK